MRLRHRHSTWILPLLLLSVLLVVLSCAPAQAGPRAWIDWPRDGFETAPGTTVTLIGHAYAQEGVAEVRLEVDRQPYRVGSPEPAGGQFVEVSVDWFPDAPGTYLLSLTAFDVNGQASNPASVTVRVPGEVPEPSVTPGPEETPPPATTPEEPVSTVAPTDAPPPPTVTAPPPTATLLRPRIVSFEVDRSQITAGGCVAFSWRVEGSPTAIYFDGEGVTSPDSRSVCPTATKEYQLRAEGPGGVDTESLTVVVVEPSPTPDTQGPPAPSPAVPANGLELSCRSSQTLAWVPVSDPSGISGYYVKLEREVIPGAWKSLGEWGAVSGKEVSVPVDCGSRYRWAVRAQDGAGNYSDWSGWSHFSVAALG